MKRIALVALVFVAVLPSSHSRAGAVTAVSAEKVGTLTLDGLSFVSFQDKQVLPLAGGTIRFHFGAAQRDGSIPFSIAPSDVSMPEIPLSDGKMLRYSLASPSSGRLFPSKTGLIVSLSGMINATLTRDGEQGTVSYVVPFTTETVSATSGGQSVQVTGLRVVPLARYMQLVGATVNKPNVIPQAGTAVYTVLSGTFDQLP